MTEEKQYAEAWFKALQQQIIAGLEQLEAEFGDPEAKFQPSHWTRQDEHHPSEKSADGGGGRMAVMRGTLFEKAGVNFSEVYGHFSPKFRKEMPNTGTDGAFWASGVSLVVHPRSPFVPIIHMNTRMITTEKQWFGGGIDLTPPIPNEAETATFHQQLQQACDGFDQSFYPKYKAHCDDYFYLPHRKEPRGVGGIFIDNHSSGNWGQDFDFIKTIGSLFLEVYSPIVRANAQRSWNEADEQAQWLKRSRYVEFNLLHDRGTRFGIMTGGNTEAILMSLPPRTGW